jgi:hypothetical protein
MIVRLNLLWGRGKSTFLYNKPISHFIFTFNTQTLLLRLLELFII